MEFRRATPGRAAGRVADRPPRARGRAAAPPAGRLRRGARLPAVRRRRRRRGRRRARVRVLERIRRLAVARRLPQPLRRDGRLDPGLRRVRGEGGRRLEVDGRRTLAEAWAWPTDRRTADGSRSASSDRLEYLRSVAEIRGRGLHASLHAYETRVFWEMRELADAAGSGGGWRSGLAGGGVPSLEAALRPAELTPVHDALRAVIAEPATTVRRAAGRRDRRRDGDGRRPGGRRRPGAARGARPAGHRRHRRPVEEAACAPVDAARAAGVAAIRRRRRGDEPGVVRGAAAGAGRGRVAAGPRHRRGRRLVGGRAGAPAARPAAAVGRRRARRRACRCGRGRVAGRPGSRARSARQPLGRR